MGTSFLEREKKGKSVGAAGRIGALPEDAVEILRKCVKNGCKNMEKYV